MKNITLSVDEAVYDAARVEAARRKTSVSAIVRDYLEGFANGNAPSPTESPESKELKNRRELVRLFRKAKLVLGYKPNREKTYER